ncbi:MAG: hypothetical protein R3B45_09805 [Bdellovibrionota bacterium]
MKKGLSLTLLFIFLGACSQQGITEKFSSKKNNAEAEIKPSEKLTLAQEDSSAVLVDNRSHLRSWSMEREIDRLYVADFFSPVLGFLIFDYGNNTNVGYGLCMQGGASESDCQDALGGDNIGYGLCMGAGRSERQCRKALGQSNIGYGLCMAAGRDHDDCDVALGADNTGFGMCMAGDRWYEECEPALGGSNIGFGFCMAGGRGEGACDRALGADNTGYGLCMAGGRRSKDCEDALGSLNTGYGLCMLGNRKESDCNDALGRANTGFGLCMAGGRWYSECNDLLGSNNTGYGLCMSAGRLEKRCDDARGANNTGYGLCMAAGRYESDCDNAIGQENVGFGRCMAAGRFESSCDNALNTGNSNAGFGICMAGGNWLRDCDDSILYYDGYDQSQYIVKRGDSVSNILNQVISSTEQVDIKLKLDVQDEHVYANGDVYIVASKIEDNGTVTFYQKNGASFNPWNGDLNALAPAVSDVELQERQVYDVFGGAFGELTGNFKLYYGYKAKGQKHDMAIKYNNNNDISFSVVE